MVKDKRLLEYKRKIVSDDTTDKQVLALLLAEI